MYIPLLHNFKDNNETTQYTTTYCANKSTPRCSETYSTYITKVLEQRMRLDAEILLHLQASGHLIFCVQMHARRCRLLDKCEGEPEQVHTVYFQWTNNYLCIEQLAKAVLTRDT